MWCVVEERLVDHNSIRAGRERGVDRDILSTRVSGRRAGRARGGFRRTCARRLRYVKLIGSALATALEGREADLRALGGRCQSGHLDLVRRRPRGRREFGLEFGKEAGAQPAGGDARPRSTVHGPLDARLSLPRGALAPSISPWLLAGAVGRVRWWWVADGAAALDRPGAGGAGMCRDGRREGAGANVRPSIGRARWAQRTAAPPSTVPRGPAG